MSAEIMKAAQVNDEGVKKHLAGKFKVDKEVASDHAPNTEAYGTPTILWWVRRGVSPPAPTLDSDAGN